MRSCYQPHIDARFRRTTYLRTNARFMGNLSIRERPPAEAGREDVTPTLKRNQILRLLLYRPQLAGLSTAPI